MTLKIALIQMDVTYGEPNVNYHKVKEYFEILRSNEVDVVVLPELWSTGYDLTRLDEIADEDGRISFKFLASLAKEYNVNIIGGSIAKKQESGVTNTMFVINRLGMLVKEYSKVHLFRLMEEEKFLVEGSNDGLFKLDEYKSAGVICYDIRFPEWIRTLMLNETEILYVVAEWPMQRIDHWRALLISRAIENQCFVVACNRVGNDPKNEFGGNSIVIGPWGEIVAEANDEEMILYADIDIEQVNKVRDSIPIFSDRRPHLYRLS